jgi:hypothetical protein
MRSVRILVTVNFMKYRAPHILWRFNSATFVFSKCVSTDWKMWPDPISGLLPQRKWNEQTGKPTVFMSSKFYSRPPWIFQINPATLIFSIWCWQFWNYSKIYSSIIDNIANSTFWVIYLDPGSCLYISWIHLLFPHMFMDGMQTSVCAFSDSWQRCNYSFQC